VPPGYGWDTSSGIRELRRLDGGHTPLTGATTTAPPRRTAPSSMPTDTRGDAHRAQQVVQAHAMAGRGSNDGWVELAQAGVPWSFVTGVLTARGLVHTAEDGRHYAAMARRRG
jgi:hypothetical protein